MKRRQFIAGLAGVAAWPIAARAQQPAMPVIGFLGTISAEQSLGQVTAFRRGLSQVGFEEGHNVAIEFRWAEGRYERLSAMAAEFVRRPVSLIAANAPPAAPRRRPPPFRSCSSSALIRWRPGWSRALTGPVATPPV